MNKIGLFLIIIVIVIAITLSVSSIFTNAKSRNKSPVSQIVSSLDKQTEVLKKINRNLEKIAVK